MINYEQILEDEIIIAMYEKIDSVNQYPFNHGMQHVKNVIGIMKKIIVALKINEEDAKNLLIAAALHDVGQVDGRDNHGAKAKEFARNYLDGKIDTHSLENILNAIEFHSEQQALDKVSLFTNLLCVADKMDFTRDRLEKDYKDRFGYLAYEDVEAVDFELTDDEFHVIITTNKKINAQDLLSKNFFPKVINVTNALANKISVSPKIFVDSALINTDENNIVLDVNKKIK